MSPDEIEIRRLEVVTFIGVPQGERAHPQRLWISVWMHPSKGFADLGDNIGKTVDYHAVALKIEALAAEKTRHLIETLATDTAAMLLADFPLESVVVKVEKKILPNAEFVAVKITRSRSERESR